MTQGTFIFKWVVYVLALLPLWLFESIILPRLGLIVLLLPMAAVAVALLEGSVGGAGYGLFVGLICDTLYWDSHGSMVFAIAGVSILVGLVTQYGIQQNLWGFFLCAAAMLLILDGGRIGIRLLNHTASFGTLLMVAVPEILLSLLFSPVVYALCRRVYRRVGGTSLV